MEKIIVSKMVVIVYVLIATIIGSYFGICNLKLRKKVNQLRKDRNELIESRVNELCELGIVLSDTEKKLIIAALNMPEYERAIADGKTGVEVRKAYRNLVGKIKESIDV